MIYNIFIPVLVCPAYTGQSMRMERMEESVSLRMTLEVEADSRKEAVEKVTKAIQDTALGSVQNERPKAG